MSRPATDTSIARGMPPAEEIRRRIQLPLRKAVGMAWRNIRVRLGRSLLLTSGIVLALAFLAYILCSDVVMNHMAATAPRDVIERLEAEGKLVGLDDADAHVRTWWLVGLALMVSFISIFNAMLLSVAERFREIGTMKCLGALDSLIVKLFLLEGLFQGLGGTAVGVVVGAALAVAQGVSVLGASAWSLLPYARLARLAGLCLAAGTALTVVGAVYPAWRASRMRPADAMRLEV